MAVQSSRDPYPMMKYQNDDNFRGPAAADGICYPVPTHLAQRQEPWQRLANQHTLSSARHEVYHFDPNAPVDDLDFVLKSQYDQHQELLKNKNEVVYQPETVGCDHGRVLKNRVVPVPEKKLPLNHPLIITGQKKKEDLNSVKTAIESHHTETTNKGFSRKPDGGFFCS